MREIMLDLNDLQVESFATLAPVPGRGTVVAHDKTDAEQTECCETYAPYVCASANDACPTAVHAWTVCAGCVETDPSICPA